MEKVNISMSFSKLDGADLHTIKILLLRIINVNFEECIITEGKGIISFKGFSSVESITR
jgi:hypothetical protein